MFIVFVFFLSFNGQNDVKESHMKKRSSLIVLFAIFSSCVVVAQQPAAIKMEDGLVQGVFENGLTIYRGIPFASPPVGNLRWRAPQPVKKWDTVLQAKKFAPG